MSAISQTHKRYLKDDDGNVYWPITAWDAVIGLDSHLSDWATANGTLIYNTVKDLIGTVSGQPGADGKSAYELAVANGFTGTEAEWLASLKPPDINKSIKLQSPNGTVFLLSVDDAGKLNVMKGSDVIGN